MKTTIVVRALAFLLVLVAYASSVRAEPDVCEIPDKSQSCGFEKWPKTFHHFLSDKNPKKWTPQYEGILKLYKLSVKDDWNVEELHHKGPHPTKYHKFALCQLQRAHGEAKLDPDKLKELIEQYIKVPVRANLCMLQKPK